MIRGGGRIGVFVGHDVSGGMDSTFSAECLALTEGSTEYRGPTEDLRSMSLSFLSLLYKSQGTHGRL